MYKNKMKNIEKGPSAQNEKKCALFAPETYTRTHATYDIICCI